MSSPKFSVILPVYKVEPYIAQCLKSLLKQTYENFELIFVNDASPDKSLEIINKYAQNDDRIKVVSNPTNYGVGKARNIGLEQAEGDFICCMDPDDWVEPYYLETIKKVFDENPDIQSVWFKMWAYFASSNYAIANPSAPPFMHFPGGKFTITPNNILDFPIYAWNKVYRAKNFKENKFFWSEGMYFEEIYFYYDYFMTNPQTYVINEFLHYYRQREGSFTRDKAIELQKLRDFFKALNLTSDLIDRKGFDQEYKNSLKSYAKNYIKQFQNTPLYVIAEQYCNEFLV